MSQDPPGLTQGSVARSEPKLADVMAAIQSMSQDVRSDVDRLIDAVERKATAPSLKSTSLNVQNQLLETSISHLEEVSETCSHPRPDLAKAEMRARAQIMKKGNAEPTISVSSMTFVQRSPSARWRTSPQKPCGSSRNSRRPETALHPPLQNLPGSGPFEEAAAATPAPSPHTSTGTKWDAYHSRSATFSSSSCWDQGLYSLQNALSRTVATSTKVVPRSDPDNRKKDSVVDGGDRKPKLDDRKRKYPQVELEELMLQEQVKNLELQNQLINLQIIKEEIASFGRQVSAYVVIPDLN